MANREYTAQERRASLVADRDRAQRAYDVLDEGGGYTHPDGNRTAGELTRDIMEKLKIIIADCNRRIDSLDVGAPPS
jgi:hypothetical protein